MNVLQRRRILVRLTKPELITLVAEGCPVCTTGPGRETTGMVCQHCGMDYAPAEHEVGSHDGRD